MEYYYISKYPIISKEIFTANLSEFEIALTKAGENPDFFKKHLELFEALTIVSIGII